MAVVAQRVIYRPPDVDQSTPVVVRCNATIRGTGSRAPDGAVARVDDVERFIVTVPGDTGQPTRPVITPSVVYIPDPADEQVIIRCTVIVRGDGNRALSGSNAAVSAQETFQVMTSFGDAQVPTFDDDNPVIEAGATHTFTLNPMGGRYDEIEYEWRLDRFSAGELDPSTPSDNDKATYTAPSAPDVEGVTYCGIFHVLVRVRGTGTRAIAGTTDEHEYRFEFEVS